MKTLYETILNSTGTGKYAFGNRLVVDGVPCTVVGVHQDKVILLSDVFNAGEWVDTEKVIPKTIADYSSMDIQLYTYQTFIKMTPSKTLGKGWKLPEADDVYGFEREKLKHIFHYTPLTNYVYRADFWCDFKKEYGSSRPHIVFDLDNPMQLSEYGNNKDVCAVRFVKWVNL